MGHALLISLSGGFQGQSVERIVASVIVGRGIVTTTAGHRGGKVRFEALQS